MSATPTRERIFALRQEIEALETGSIHGFSAARRHLQGQVGFAAAERLTLGHAQADDLLGGLTVAAIHDVLPAGAPDMAAASGFALGLIARLRSQAHAARKPWAWLRQDLAGLEVGEPYGPGLAALGLSPNWLVAISAADGPMLLRVAEETLRAHAFCGVLMEPWGNPKALDLTASRRLALAALESGCMGVLLRSGGQEIPGSVATRWLIRAHPSHGHFGPERPTFDVELTRNRRGRTGRWAMEWSIDEQSFAPRQTAPPLSGGVFAHPAERPPGAAGILRTG
ncbi:ImuA family protein [Methylovirgula sp. 4M-Z18]|uniref:ImuA family protein n=1 Tax=Methylovirgula sp. 4M-Z18 TaxID=2293567 RepID=UPI000E2E7D39|nr:DNA repair protein [Methylovirgula sp. 4M-Z18]RFB78671.1 DNA repair protein [Methylovirgula sp. 4M-Z18]